MLDTGFNIPESRETLLVQQLHLVEGHRDVQMFPLGTVELALPPGINRIETHRGVFHYNPAKIDADRIMFLSQHGKENEMLCLGPVSKPEVINRINAGEQIIGITEYTPSRVEVRSAVGTIMTMAEQMRFFERTKKPENHIVAGPLPKRVAQIFEAMQ